jgi:predicted glycosyltransferase
VTASVLLHVQYLLGIGHLQRTLRIANALAEAGVAVTLVSGGFPVTLPRHPAIRFVQLPPVRARDARYELIDGNGRPLDDALREKRRKELVLAFAEARPDAVVIEGYPLARRGFRFELEPLIEAVRAARPKPRLLCSVRDIVVMRDDAQRHRDIVERVRRDFDAVMVHGDPALIRLDASFPATPEIAARLIYTGYVGPELREREGPGEGSVDGSGEVVVSAGGGAAGFRLLQAALAACRAGCLPETRWRFLTGTHLPEAEFARLRADAPHRAIVERFQEDLAGLLGCCRVSVSQAGYNTVLDILAAGARAVLVPFAAEGETEQLTRAKRLAELGVAELVREDALSPETLAAAIERAESQPPTRIAIDTRGSTRSARLIAAMIASPGWLRRGFVSGSDPAIIN